MSADLASQVIRSKLSGSECLLWAGQPRQGVFLRLPDFFRIPFSLMWGGFAFYWEYLVINSGAPLIFKLWGIPFVLVGIYVIIGRFFFDAISRKKTFYAVTDERVIIHTGVFTATDSSISLRNLPKLSFTKSGSGYGTISFPDYSGFGAFLAFFGAWLRPNPYVRSIHQFDSIHDADRVYAIIREAQKAAA